MTARDFESSCSGKEKLSYDLAVKIARRETSSNLKRAPYRCRFCHTWHVGTSVIPKHLRREH